MRTETERLSGLPNWSLVELSAEPHLARFLRVKKHTLMKAGQQLRIGRIFKELVSLVTLDFAIPLICPETVALGFVCWLTRYCRYIDFHDRYAS